MGFGKKTVVSTQATPETAAGGLDVLVATNDFWRNRYTSLLRVVAIQALIVVGLIALVAFLVVERPQPHYFAVDNTGHVLQIEPLSKPFLSNDALTQWAADTARMSYSLDFVNWRDQLGRIRDRFSDTAYKDFLRELDASGNLALVKDQRVILESVTDPARIVRSTINASGRYEWTVEVPMSVVTHYGGTSQRSQRLLVTLQITRVDVRFRPDSGVVVTQLLSRIG